MPQFSRLEGHVDALLYIGILLACYAICRWPGWSGLLLSSTVSLVAMLQHEAYLFMFYPAVLVLAFTQVVRGRIRLWALLLNAFLLAAGFLLILHYGNLKISLDQTLGEALSRTNASLDNGVFTVMNRGFNAQLAENLRVYCRFSTLPAFVLSLLLAVPYFALLRLLLKRSLQAMEDRWGRLRNLILPVLLIPMFLVIAGGDLMRWVSAVCIDTTLVVFFWYRFSSIESPLRSSLQEVAGEPWFTAIFVYFLAIGPFDIQFVKVVDVLSHFLLNMRHFA